MFLLSESFLSTINSYSDGTATVAQRLMDGLTATVVRAVLWEMRDIRKCLHGYTLLYWICLAADESGSGQAEGMDMVVCRAPGGEFYVEGETWDLDECTRCTCQRGRVLCDSEVCPPALCHAPIRNKESCCHVCPGNPPNTDPESKTLEPWWGEWEQPQVNWKVLRACGFGESCL